MTFDIDADGVVEVSAKDLGTGKSQQVRVTASSGLSEQEIQELISQAEQHSAADGERRELADLRNKADGLVYSTERALEEFAEQVAEEDRAPLEKALGRTRAALDGSDCDALRRAVDELSTLSYQMTEKLYSSLGGEASE